MGGKQLGFSDYEQTTAKKQTKREKFLAEMEAVVPWDALVAPDRAHLSQVRQEGRASSLPAGDHAADPPAAAVVLPQ